MYEDLDVKRIYTWHIKCQSRLDDAQWQLQGAKSVGAW